MNKILASLTLGLGLYAAAAQARPLFLSCSVGGQAGYTMELQQISPTEFKYARVSRTGHVFEQRFINEARVISSPEGVTVTQFDEASGIFGFHAVYLRSGTTEEGRERGNMSFLEFNGLTVEELAWGMGKGGGCYREGEVLR